MDSKNKRLVGSGLIVALILILGFALFGSGLRSSISGLSVSGQEETREIKEFSMMADEFEFSPRTIIVNEGDTVILHIESLDVEHGIAIPQFGVSQTLPVGEIVSVEFVADKAGTYTFFCNVYCGADHRSMKGTLIVE